MVIRRILFPTDFSGPAHLAQPHVIEIARRFGSDITLLHVRVPFLDDPTRPEYHFLDEGRYAKHIENQLKLVSIKLGSDHPVFTAITRNITPSAGILEYVEQQETDLVVMGTHGRSALGRFFLGSVTEKVVRHAPCPVLTVAEGRGKYLDNPVYQNIVAPFDFSEYSTAAVKSARELANRFGGALQILYVLAQEVHPSFYELCESRIHRVLPGLEEKAIEALSEILEEGAEGHNVHVEVAQAGERASEGIVRFAKTNNADLLVMGTHGLTGIERVLLGSTTERVVRTAPCPVLTIHKGQQLSERTVQLDK
jgi:nucleotide-binding universal stress UspA family protein